jgi:D-alanyl-D-alanine carboxypeptidase
MHPGKVGRLRAGAVVTLIALWLAACGGDAAEQASPSPSLTPGRSTTAGPSPSPPPAVTSEPTVEPTSAPAPETLAPTEAPPPLPAPDLSLLIPVDKQRALPADYAPPDLAALGAAYLAPGFGGSLRVEAKAAVERMLSAAFDNGHDIYARSAYRSYAEQERTFAYWVSVLGEAEARRISAEPGHSEHQLGSAADLTTAEVGYDLTEAFGDTGAGRWLAENAHTYGFALSYPAGAEAITGYAYEPWHFRYIGTGQAAAWKASGLTLVEYLRSLE